MSNLLRYSVLSLLLLLNACVSKNYEVRQIPNGVEIRSGNDNLKVQFYDYNMVRVLKWPDGSTPDKVSLSVIQKEIPDIDIKIEDKDKQIILTSSGLVVEINKINGLIKYVKPGVGTILQEKEFSFDPVAYHGDSAYHIKQGFSLSDDEGLYGLGQHQYGYMNYRGKEVVLVQSNTDAVNPFLVSTQGYGILWDNYSKTVFEDNENGASLWSDLGDNIDYYFIAGENIDQAIDGYRKLTGQAPMYGKWAFGYWQSKEHYRTQTEILNVAREYRRRKIPIDNMIQDWNYWYGRENWSGMFFHKDVFPEPEKMVQELHDMNYHLMISIWPALGPNTEIYKDMLQRGFLYDPIGWAGFKYYDAFNPDANQLYWQYLRDGLLSKGIDGWWIDSTEPDVINALTKDATEYEMKKIGQNHLGSWARYLNAFSIAMTDPLYKNLRQETDQKRAYILTRSAYAGQQRNAATTWSGDIGASWEEYKHQISAGVNHCMSGIPYWTFDIGAFVLGSYGGVFSTGGKSPSYQELYTRMFQFGAFTPIFRSHGSETPREIWEFGDFVPTLINFDNLRYRLLPYIYSLSWQVTNNNYTIMRGLPMDFVQDKNTYNIADQYMFGPAFMVSPVTEFMYHQPPESSKLIAPEYFYTKNGRQGLEAKYYSDKDFTNITREKVDPQIDIYWYGGRPDYVTDSMYSIRWEGKLIPDQSGRHQFHIKTFDGWVIYLDGKRIPAIYEATEKYTDYVDLEAGRSYDFVVENSNNQTGAARMLLFWKTPDLFEKEKTTVETVKTRQVYLPNGSRWIDFWTGEDHEGGKDIQANAPIDIMPLMVRAGSIIPMGPFLQYSTEKPADPIELRIYPGANGSFTLYEDENDNYNYEKGVFATIDFDWNDTARELTISERKGEYPGMLRERIFNIVIVTEGKGIGIELENNPNKTVRYTGNNMKVGL